MNVEKLEKYKQHGQHLAVALGNVYGAKCPLGGLALNISIFYHPENYHPLGGVCPSV